MKGLGFSVVRYGYLWNDPAWNLAIPAPATKSNPRREASFEKFPCWFALIQHPEAGYILFDTGEYPPGENGWERPDYWNEMFVLDAKREDFIDRQLPAHGVNLDDIQAIILSHMHCDHANGLKFFSNSKAGQNIYVSRTNFSFAAAEALNRDDVMGTASAYWRNTMTIPGLTYHYIDEETELFPGVHTLLFDGHSPGVIGLRLELESGNYLLPSDACGNADNFGPPSVPSGMIYDSLNFHADMKKLRQLQKEYNATILFSHDQEQDETVRHFPEFYY